MEYRNYELRYGRLGAQCLLMFAALLGVEGATQAADNQAAREAFLRNWNVSGPAVVEKYRHYECRYKLTAPTSPGDYVERYVEAKVSGNKYLLISQLHVYKNGREVPPPIKAKRVEGNNTTYTFNLKQESTDKVTLSDYRAAGSRPPESSPISVAYMDTFMRMQTYADIARDASVRITGYQDVQWQGAPAKELKVEYEDFVNKTSKNTTYVQSYYFPRSGRMACLGMRVFGSSESPQVDDIYTYQEYAAGSVPVIKRIQRGSVELNNPVKSRTSFDIEVTDFHSTPPIPDSEFTLGAFGLPEPAGMSPPKSIPIYVWFLVAAGACGLGASGFRFLARRKRVMHAA